MKRQKRIKVNGSPSFQYQPSISANDRYIFDPAPSSKESKYKPFDKVIISNDSGSDIIVKVNGSHNDKFIVESGTSRSKTEITKFETLEIVEQSGSSVSSGDLTIEVQRQPFNADQEARENLNKDPINRIINKFTGL